MGMAYSSRPTEEISFDDFTSEITLSFAKRAGGVKRQNQYILSNHLILAFVRQDLSRLTLEDRL